MNYTQGALRYVFQTPNTNWGKVQGRDEGTGVLSDAVFNGTLRGVGADAATDLQLTTAWNINAAYEHFWNPRWRTSLYGGYAQVSYSGNANSLLCGRGTNGIVTSGCDSDWQTWWAGSRTQWNVTKDFYMGLDVMYSKLQSAAILGAAAAHRWRDACLRRGQLAVPLPRAPRLLSVIVCMVVQTKPSAGNRRGFLFSIVQ